MKIELRDGVLSVSELKELDGAHPLCQPLRSRLSDTLQAIELDLSQTEFLNSVGLSELIALQKMAWQHNHSLAVRVLNPPPPLQQLFELTRLHQVFEICKAEPTL